MATKSIITKHEIDAFEGTAKAHFLNPAAKRVNKSLGDLVGLTGLGFHIIELEPGAESTEKHVHYFEDECAYILEGEAEVIFGNDRTPVYAGDFIGYPSGGEAHTMINTGTSTLKCIVVGQRLGHDVVDYPEKGKRLFRNEGQPWNLVDIEAVIEPVAGKK